MLYEMCLRWLRYRTSSLKKKWGTVIHFSQSSSEECSLTQRFWAAITAAFSTKLLSYLKGKSDTKYSIEICWHTLITWQPKSHCSQQQIYTVRSKMELFLEAAGCTGDMAENKQPQNHILGWKTPAVLQLGLTMAKLASLGCGTQEPG